MVKNGLTFGVAVATTCAHDARKRISNPTGVKNWFPSKTNKLCPERLGEEDLGFGFDYEEGVGVVMALGAEFLDGFVYGGSLRGEDDGAVVAADEVEAALLLD